MKTISALSSIALAAATASIALANCTVTPAESCLTGPCELPTGTTSTGAPVHPGDYPCAIYDIVHRKCQVCHATALLSQSGAPFSLLTWEDTQLPLFPGSPKPRYMRMGEVILPSTIPHMPFGCGTMSGCPPSGDLSADEHTALETWVMEGGKPVPQGVDQMCSQMCDGAPCKPQ